MRHPTLFADSRSPARPLLSRPPRPQVAARDPRFRATYALSREMTKPDGTKVYVQDKVQHAASPRQASRLQQGGTILDCGRGGSSLFC